MFGKQTPASWLVVVAVVVRNNNGFKAVKHAFPNLIFRKVRLIVMSSRSYCCRICYLCYLCHHLKVNPNNLTFFVCSGREILCCMEQPMPPGDGDYMQENTEKINKHKNAPRVAIRSKSPIILLFSVQHNNTKA